MIQKDARRSQYKLLLTAMTLVFVMFLAYTIIWEIDYFSKYGNFHKTRAEVIGHYEEDGKVYDTFVFETEDHKYVEKVSSFESKYDIGDNFNVYYDENMEIEVIYSRDIRVVMLPIITVGFGSVSTVFYVMYYLQYHKKKKEVLNNVEDPRVVYVDMRDKPNKPKKINNTKKKK